MIIWRRVPRSVIWLLLNPHILAIVLLSAVLSLMAAISYRVGQHLCRLSNRVRCWNTDSDNRFLTWPTWCGSLSDWCKVEK